MKKTFSTVACMNATVEMVVEACEKYSMDGVEIRMTSSDSFLDRNGLDAIAAAGRGFEAAGIKVIDLGSSICLQGKDTESILENAKGIIKAAVVLGAKGIRVFLGHFAARVNPQLPEPDYESIVSQLQKLCSLAAQSGVEIWVETHNEFATGKVLKQLMKDVNCDNLKVIWDIMHTLEDGEGIEETWRLIGGSIVHVHIKDGYDRQDKEWHDYRYTCLGEGALPIGSVLDLLQVVGYSGYISLEWESAWRQELREYDNSLDWVLKQYTEFMQDCEDNPVPVIGDEWKMTDAPGKADWTVFHVSEKKAEAVIDNRVLVPSCKRYVVELPVVPGKSYRLSVPFTESDTIGKNVVYGLITLINEEDARRTRRIYLERSHSGCMELTFGVKSEAKLRIELGIKRGGRVVWHRPLLQEQIVETCESGPTSITSENWQKRKLKVASVHLGVNPFLTYEGNLDRISEAFDRAAVRGADLLAFAETMNTRGINMAYEESFEPMEGIFCTMMKRKAKEHECYVFFTFRELDEYGARRNSAVLLNREGQVVGRYHKTHLALAEYENGMVPGDSYPVFDTEFGKVGMLICWDTYFPEPAKVMALQGAEILLVSTAGNPTYRHIARAKENGVYVVVACAAPNEESGIAPTKIIDPCGNIIAHTKTEGEAAVADIDLDEEKMINWLSVGPFDAMPNNIYRHEYRDDMMPGVNTI